METVVGVRRMFVLDVLALSVVDEDGAKWLNEAEIDGLRCEKGNGSMTL
jgi:hypothetical protein